MKGKIFTLLYCESGIFPIISELPIRGTSTHISANDGKHSIPTLVASKSRIKDSRSYIAELQTKNCRLAVDYKVNKFIKFICPLPYPIFVIPNYFLFYVM